MSGELSGGLLVKIDTSAAIKATNELKASNQQLFTSLATLDKEIVQLETRYRSLAAAEKTATAARAFPTRIGLNAGSPAPPPSFQGFGQTASGLFVPQGSLPSQQPLVPPVPANVPESFDRTTKSGKQLSVVVGQLVSATGESGLAKSFKGVSGVARLLVGALNPVGVAAALVTGAVITMSISALTAQTRMEQLTEASAKTARELDLSADAFERISSAVRAAAEARQAMAAITASSGDAEARTNALRESFARLRDEMSKGRILQLTGAELVDFVKAAGLGERAVESLGRAIKVGRDGNAALYAAELKELADAGLKLGTVRTESFLSTLGITNETLEPVLNAIDAVAVLNRLLAQTGETAAAIPREFREIERELIAIERQTALLQETDEKRTLALQRQFELADKLAALEAQRTAVNTKDIDAAQEMLRTLLAQKNLAEDWRRELEKVGQVGAQVGGQLADALSTAAFAAGGFSKNIGDAIEDMGKALASQTLREFLSLFGQKAAQLLFTRSNPAPAAGFTPGVFDMQGRVHGAPSEYAQTGLLLDRRQTISRNGRRIGVAEGGQSTPEAIFPLQRDQFGRLSLAAPEGMGEIHVHTNIRTAADARAARPTIRQTVEQIGRAGFRPGARGRA